MKKLFCLLISISLLGNIYPAQWRHGAGENTILGSESASDIDSASYDDVIAPLDRGLSNLQEGCKISYLSASTITVGAGEIMLSNAGGTIRLIQQNTSATTVSWTMIEAGGSESASTTYYLYAYQATATDTDFDVVISTSSSAPASTTYYARLGSFYNDSSSNIDKTLIVNDNETAYPSMIDPFVYDSGWFAVGAGANYTKTHNLGTTNVLAVLYGATSSAGANMGSIFAAEGNDGQDKWSNLYGMTTTSIGARTSGTDRGYIWNGTARVSFTYLRIIMLALE